MTAFFYSKNSILSKAVIKRKKTCRDRRFFNFGWKRCNVAGKDPLHVRINDTKM